jgi:hypothetical protein
MKRIIVSLLMLLALPFTLAAQNPAAAQREEMKKLNFMVGEWKGEGWIITPGGKRHEFIQTENIRYKLDGLALLVEGTGRRKPSNTVTFEAIGVIFYDERAKQFRMHSGTTEGHSGVSDMKLIEGGLQWSPQATGGRLRYTIKLTEKGEWHEVGEYSQDGNTWQKFHEMTLQKVK